MKIRTNFVSNSSSSSYICDSCGWKEDSWEAPDGWNTCEIGHGFCEDCSPDINLLVKELLTYSDEKLDSLGLFGNDLVKDIRDSGELEEALYDTIIGDGLPKIFCPVCNFTIITQEDLKKYLLVTSNISEDTVFQQIKAQNKRRQVLRPEEYVSYVCGQLGKSIVDITEIIKARFQNLDELHKFLKEEENEE